MEEKKRIILVDDDLTSLAIGKRALSEDYEVITAPSSAKMAMILAKFQPDLILLDGDLPDMDGFETLRRLRTANQTAEVPVIFTSARDDNASHEKALRFGASDIIVKPYLPMLIRKTVQRHLTLLAQKKEIARYEETAAVLASKRRSSLIHFQDALLDTLAGIADDKTQLTTTWRAGAVRKYLTLLTGEMRRENVYFKELRTLEDDSFIASAQLHDVGKIIVNDRILQKPGRLTPEEFEAVKRHTSLGVKIIEGIEENTGHKEFTRNAKLFAATHHERWDGRGYPLKLKRNDIPLQGRLMAIVDVYDALVSHRPYKRPISHEQARGIIIAGSGVHFDPLLTKAFLAVSDEFAEIHKDRNGSIQK